LNSTELKNAKTRPRIIRCLDIDLNGDGQKETLLEAQSHAIHGNLPEHVKNFYSVVLLRFIDRTGKAHVVPLAAQATRWGYDSDCHSRTIIGLVDMDGDGKTEVVLDIGEYEGSGMLIIGFDGIKPVPLFRVS